MQTRQKKRTLPQKRNVPRVDKLLSSIYEDISHPDSFSTPYRLYQAAKKINSRIKLKDIEEWLEGSETYTRHRQVVSNFPRRKILVRGPQFQYQADLMDYQPIARENDGMHYLLTVIDCFSRFATIIPLKSKEGIVVRNGLKKAFDFMGYPTKLQTDEGKEFYNHVCKYFFEQNKIIHFSTFQEVKAAICERFNRTVRNKIKKYMTHNKTLRFVDILPDIVMAYNSRKHSSFERKFAPKEVNEKNRKSVYELLYGEYLRARKKKFKFRVGDMVRVASYRETFRQRDKHNFSQEIFVVVECRETNPPTYVLADRDKKEQIQGVFYENQLQRWRPRKK
jgi:hypothetical protein